MAWYTTQVKTICESLTGMENKPYKEVIPEAIPKIFDFDFPLFDENYRNILCTKILKRYYMKEIAHETVGLWKLRLDTTLNEIMPYYNQLYKSALLEFNPFVDVDYTRKGNKTANNNKVGTLKTSGTITDDSEVKRNLSNTSTNTETNSNKTDDINNTTLTKNSEADNTLTINKSLHNENEAEKTLESTNKDIIKTSDTPQGGLDGIESDKYLTKAQINDSEKGDSETNTSSSDSTEENSEIGNTKVEESVIGVDNRKIESVGTITGTNSLTGIDNATTSNLKTNESTNNENYTINSLDDYIETISGKQSAESYSSLLLKFRETFLNIDVMILDDLSKLFYGLWDFQGGQINGWI